MQADLDVALADAGEDEAISAVILRGAGPSFSAGHDMGIERPKDAYPGGPLERESIMADRKAVKAIVDRCLLIWDLPIPVIAQIQGHCLASASEIALVCDLKLAAADARIGWPAVRSMGTPPVQIYAWLAGINRAKELVLTGDTVSGAEAARMGLVNRAVPAADLEREVEALAARIGHIPRDLLTFNKLAVNRTFEAMGFRTALHLTSEFDTMAHYTRAFEDFSRRIRDQGLKAALEWRDAPHRKG
jgi:enoyl-CoA hydratase